VVAQFHLCLQRTGLSDSFWNGVSTQHKHYWSPVTSTMWHKGGWTDQKNGPSLGRTDPWRKQKEGTKKGFRCKLLKRKKITSSLANSCAICLVALSLGSFLVEQWSFLLLHGYKNACSHFNLASWRFRLALLPPWRPRLWVRALDRGLFILAVV
jgi:hypothetical protein